MNTATIEKDSWSAVAVGSCTNDLKRVLNIQFREFLYWLYDVDIDKPQKIDATVIKSLYRSKTA